jgi:hypothetical protein
MAMPHGGGGSVEELNFNIQIMKKFLIIVSILIGLLLVWWVGSAAYSGWMGYKWQKKTDAFQAALEQPYKEDTYGGKTPEETWAMYISALEKKDFDLASKYYALSNQQSERDYLNQVNQKGDLDKWIAELKTLEKDSKQSDQSRPIYSYQYYDKEFKKQLWGSVIFYQNPYTKVWKLL